MTTGRRTSTFGASIALVCAVQLAGCSIARDPVTTFSSADVSAPQDVEFVVTEEESALRARFAGVLKSSFAERGIADRTGSGRIADFAIASRDAGTTIVAVGQDGNPVPQPAGNDPTAKWYHKCRPTRVKGSLALYDRASNALVGKSEGNYIGCPDDLSKLEALADLLVGEALGAGLPAAVQE